MRKNESTGRKVLKQPFSLIFWTCDCVHHFHMHKTGTGCNKYILKSLILKYIFSKIPQMFCKEFQIFKTFFNVWAWVDSFKYQIVTLQNQKVADEEQKFFLLRQGRIISSDSILTQNISSRRDLKLKKKKDGSR